MRFNDERTYEFCFDGIENSKTVALGTHGCLKSKKDKEYFKAGLAELVKRLSPQTIIVYGSATKRDSFHGFSDIVDNYAGQAKTFTIKGGDGKNRILYQIKGSLNGKKGIFEWIHDPEIGVTHRRFITNGKVTGIPNSR